MSIIGLSEKLRLPRKGKIRLGEKKVSEKTGKEFPSALDYFAVPDEVKEVYGDKPRKLDIMFPMENRDSYFPQWYKRYGSSKGLICKGDGKTAVQLPVENGEAKLGDMKEIDCEGKECPYYQDRKCKQVGNLQIILPKVKGLGIYQIDTSSYNSIININSGIELIRGMLARVGINRISWIPLVLEVKMQEAHPVVKNKRIKTIIPVMSVDLEMSVESMMKMLKGSALPAPTAEIDNPDLHDKPELLFPKKDGSIPSDEEQKRKEEDRLAKEKKGELVPLEDMGETEVKDEPEAKPEHDKEWQDKTRRTWYRMLKIMYEINFFSDEPSYRAWMAEEFDSIDSYKELTDNQRTTGINLMVVQANKHEEEK